MAENFPNLMKNFNQHIQATQETSSKIKMKRPTNEHMIVKLLKAKRGGNLESNERKMTSFIIELQ